MPKENLQVAKPVKHSLCPAFYTLLIAMLLCFGCEQYTINKAMLIERDAQTTCIEVVTDRCALPSQIQHLANQAMTQPESSNTLHYISILDVGEDSLLARIHLIRAATESIVLQTFIWDDDEVGQLLFMELLKAARRGVKVRMVLDQYGCYIRPKVMAAMDTSHENIEIKLYRPILKRGAKSPAQDIGGAITDAHMLYMRMHNKLFAVDERIGIVGGRNIQDAYFDHGNKVNFKDLDLLVVGPVVKDMYKSFQLYWDNKLTVRATDLYDIANAALKLKESDYVNLFDSPEFSELTDLSEKADSYSIIEERDTLQLYPVYQIEYIADWPVKKKKSKKAREWDSTSRLGEILLQAEHSVQLQTPYLIQDFKGIQTMKAFRKEKPEVEISLSTNSLSSADMFFVYAIIFKQRQLYIETLRCKMYEFKAMPADAHTIIPRFSEIVKEGIDETDLNEDPELLVPLEFPGPRFCVHAKFFVVDEHISAVGSHNFDPRAKNINTENAVIIWDDTVAKAIKEIFDRDTAPQNSWVVARRQKPPIVGNVSELIAAISSALPVFDVWPFDYSSNFELKENKDPIPPDHPDFYEHYKNVGPFPSVGISPNRLGVRFIKAFGGIARGLM